MAGPSLSRSALDLYRSLIDERLRGATCAGCGRSLGGASVERTEGGAAFDEYQLSDPGQARLLAETVLLAVRCRACGTEARLGTPPRAWREPAAPALPAPLPWPPAAVALYREGIAERLAEASCGRCGTALGGAEVVRAAGGTVIDDYPLSDVSLARLLAATQHLCVRCRHCQETSELCDRHPLARG